MIAFRPPFYHQLLKFKIPFNLKNGFHSYIDILPEVKDGLEQGAPIVALESTIITHGMPFPQNIQMAQEVEDIVRGQNAIPATIGIVKGRIKVGLSEAMKYELIEEKSRTVKTSRRDFPFVISQKMNGGTTVSGTMVIADLVGITVFVTGGIGGVHRAVEKSMDVSADLTELGRTPIAVVSSGVKSILDIPRTLEYLETQGVCVATLGDSADFPAFYCRSSGCKSPYQVGSPQDAAELIKSLLDLDLRSGLLLAVPIPEQDALSGTLVDSAIHGALKEADERGITGKEVTPFILKKVVELTGGASLAANIALVRNNATVGADIAVELHRLLSSSARKLSGTQDSSTNESPVVIGGSNLDCLITVKEDSIKSDGHSHIGEVRFSAGGVGRNLADALAKLGLCPLFLTATGSDTAAAAIQHSLVHLGTGNTVSFTAPRSSHYGLLLKSDGEVHLGVADMNAHGYISPESVMKYAERIKKSPLLILDGNIPGETITTALRVAAQSNVPVWFEPTDITKVSKPFRTELWKTMDFVSPNFNELKQMVSSALPAIPERFSEDMHLNPLDSKTDVDILVCAAARLGAILVAEGIRTVLVTLGSRGIVVVRRGNATDNFFIGRRRVPRESETSVKISGRRYSVTPLADVLSVSGAGDCWAAGFATAALRGLPEYRCVSSGIAAANCSLHHYETVPQKLEDIGQYCFSPQFNTIANYKDIPGIY